MKNFKEVSKHQINCQENMWKLKIFQLIGSQKLERKIFKNMWKLIFKSKLKKFK